MMILRKYKIRLWIRSIIFFIGLIIFIFSFVRDNINDESFKRGNVIFVLDVSNSMNVEDVFYNNHQVSRLTLAKKIIKNNIETIDNQVGLILFSNKSNYFIVPTLDKKTFLTYLDTVNTNNLDGGKTDFIKSLNSINKLVYPTDILVIMSDFDTEQNIKKIKIKNFVYTIGLGTSKGGIVKNNESENLYMNNNIILSSFNVKNMRKISKYTKSIKNYKKGEILSFLESIYSKRVVSKDKKIDILDIFSFIMIILAL